MEPHMAYAGNTILKVDIDGYSEPISIHDFTRHWQGDFQGGRHAFLLGRAELTYQEEKHEMSLIWRYDYLLNFSKDTAEIYNAYSKNLLPNTQRNYDLNLTANYTEARGIRWTPRLKMDNGLTISPGINVLQGNKLTDGHVSGNTLFSKAGFGGNDFKTADLSIDYRYSRPELHEEELNWQPNKPTGIGGSLDLRVDWQPNEYKHIAVQLYDVYGQINWHKTPATQYHFNYQSAPQSYNLTGQLGLDDQYIQHLPMRGILTGDFANKTPWLSGFVVNANRYIWLGQLYVGYQSENFLTKFIIEPQTKSFGLDLSNSYLEFRWLADSINTNNAYRLGAALSIRIPFH